MQADDGVLFLENHVGYDVFLWKCVDDTSRVCMLLQIMVVEREVKSDFNRGVDAVTLEVVNKFLYYRLYLSVEIDKNGGCRKEFENRGGGE